MKDSIKAIRAIFKEVSAPYFFRGIIICTFKYLEDIVEKFLASRNTCPPLGLEKQVQYEEESSLFLEQLTC